jgi:hypothetical protein
MCTAACLPSIPVRLPPARSNPYQARSWVLLEDLQKAAPQTLYRFMLRTNAAKSIPRPGDVDVIAGGPPCQEVRGWPVPLPACCLLSC